MKTPARNSDLRHVRTGLSKMDIHEAINESAKLKEIKAQIAELGERYLLHPANAPAKGTYHPTTGLRLA